MLFGKKNTEIGDLDYKCANNIKCLALDMINNSGSGHSGVCLSAGNIIYDIYARHLVFDKNNDKWINRDRFVLSNGHASALLYSCLYMCGYLDINDLKKFRTINSNTPGHPNCLVTKGVDVSTGVLGEGIGNAVGMAIAERFLNNRYKYNKNNSLIDHYTYVLCGDGDLMEGVSYEACSLAGSLGLSKLIILYDCNNCTADGDLTDVFDEDVLKRFEAMNFNTYAVSNKIEDIDNAIKLAKTSTSKPSFIMVKTILGEYSKYQNSYLAHSKVFSKEEIGEIKNSLGIRNVSFTVSGEAFSYFNDLVDSRNSIVSKWNKKFKSIFSNLKEHYKKEIKNLIDFKREILFDDIDVNLEMSQRDISKSILEKVFVNDNLCMIGSCDLARSTGVDINVSSFTKNNYGGKSIKFGVREHAMGAIMNGIALTGIKTFASTMLVFSDHLKPSIRMSALMGLDVTYIFSHDSFLVGEDGGTHEPIEQLVSLRSIPNLTLYRPYDVNEYIGSFKSIFDNKSVSVLITSKNDVLNSKYTKINDACKGGYVLKSEKNATGILIATGYEVLIALNIYERLKKEGIFVNVVSMPSIELFEKQSNSYKEKVLPLTFKKAVIEYASSYSWYKYVYGDKYLFTIDHFGKSGNKNDLAKEFSLDEDSIYVKVKDLLK